MTHHVRIVGPLAAHRDGLWASLMASRYTTLSAANLMRVAAHLSRWLDSRGLSAAELTTTQVGAFLRHRRASGYTCWLSPKGLAPILEHLRDRGAAPPAEAQPLEESALERLLHEYRMYLLSERGIRPQTASGYVRLVGGFAADFVLPDLSGTRRLSTADVSRFILDEARSSSVGFLKLKVTALRSFLRYLHVRGFCADLSAAVPAVAGHRLSGLPKAIPEETVNRLLESCDRTIAAGRRDYAVLMLLSRLALRAVEVATLELEDVRWESGEIQIRGKGSEGVLPLPEDVGKALAAYLLTGRPPASSRRVFQQTRAPYGDISISAICGVVRNACQRAGLPAMGAHRLRHSAATMMLRKGVSLPDIALVLRHRTIATTAIYAKVDRAALRTLARPWPGSVS